jgi:hypothetical protein
MIRPALVLSIVLLAASARAEGDGASTYAEQLFSDGVRLMREDKCPEAIGKFVRSLELDPGAGTLVNLATCYARVGRTASAWKTYQKAAGAADKEGNAELKAQALKALGILEPQLVKLSVSVPERVKPVTVRVNGEVVDVAAPLPIDPGPSVVEAQADGRETWRQTVNAEAKGATIVVQVPEPAAAVVAAPPTEAHGWGTSQKVAIVVGGVGVVSLLVGTAFGLSAISTYGDSNDYCIGDHCNQRGSDLRNTAATRADVSTVTIGLGAAAVAAGVIVWFTAPSATTGVGLRPVVGAGRAGMVLETRL